MHEKYMKMALIEAEKALQEGDFPVGCVLADNRGIICSGRRKNSNEENELDHAEIMALRNLHEYHNDRIHSDIRVYATMEPCLMCYSTLILNNIHTIVYAYEDVMGGGTNLSIKDLSPLYASKDIHIIPGVLRSESLRLFKDFFSLEGNGYLQNSLLAKYTLRQGQE